MSPILSPLSILCLSHTSFEVIMQIMMFNTTMRNKLDVWTYLSRCLAEKRQNCNDVLTVVTTAAMLLKRCLQVFALLDDSMLNK